MLKQKEFFNKAFKLRNDKRKEANFARVITNHHSSGIAGVDNPLNPNTQLYQKNQTQLAKRLLANN
jgi:hypothetical protein